ncbi:hypothetical protein ABZ916_25885 [Streptomyces sp. NPDC046853]|uniref:hypothetical protein n=1 Tax=Streptomyces sp. NPDC046853 TaxID=3154920 RepID=UPI0033DCFD5F
MAQTVDVAAIRRHLDKKTTLELCDDFEHLTKSTRRMPWAEQAVTDALFTRNETAWLEWQMSGDLLGPAMPHQFFAIK